MKAWKCNQIDLWRGMAFSSFQRYCLLFPFASSTTNASVVKNKDWLLIVREALTRRPKQQDFILRGCFPPAILLTITVCWIIEGGPHRFSARLSFAKSYLSSFFRQSSFEVDKILQSLQTWVRWALQEADRRRVFESDNAKGLQMH